jgi:serine/threonine protein kinase/Tol biopolymer transport system component
MPDPQVLNHYRILGPIGRGGMGEVFVAEDTKLHRKVALKILPAVMAADPERRIRFEREAQAVAAINHPNIVTLHSVEEADGVPFLTMELVEGKPLSEVMAAGALPVDTLLRTGIAISDAMAAAHQRGITHRDLKPGNVMVTPDGRIKVLDFGLAKLREEQLAGAGDDVTRMPTTDITGEGRILGTVAYMSPEQAEGKAVDQRSDIFSLGVMLHEMATGEKPFKGDTNVSVISSILKDNPSSITDLNPALPAGLSRVIRRSLAKDPSRRYQTATDLRNDLEELKQEVDSGLTMSASGIRPAVRSESGSNRRKVIAAAVVIVLLAVVAGGLWSWRSRASSKSNAGAAEFQAGRFTRLTSSGNAFLAAISPDGNYVVHVKNTGTQPALFVRQTATTSDVQIVPPAQVRYDGITYAPDGNYVYYNTYVLTGGVATLYRVPVLGGPPERILEDVDSRISFSPDHQRFTFVRGAPSVGAAYLMVANADGSNPTQLAQLSSPELFANNGPAWSPDGKTIIASAQSQNDPLAFFVAVNVATGATTRIQGQWPFAGDVEWLPDGKSFAAIAVEFAPGTPIPQIWQITFPSGEARRITNDLNNYLTLAFSANAKTLATVQGENISNLWVAPAADLAGGKAITSGRSRADGLSGLAWTPDGRIVFGSTASGRQEIWIIDADGSNPRQLTNAPAPSISPSVTPDGRYIVFQRFSQTGVDIWRMGLDGSDPKQLTRGGVALTPQAATDFVYYSTGGSSPRPWKVPIDGGQPAAMGDFYFRPTQLSPDGTRLLGAGWDQKERRSVVAVLSVAGGVPEVIPELPPNRLAWNSDSRGFTFLAPQGGALQLLKYTAGQKPQPLATIEDNIFGFVWAPDGKRAVIARGQGLTDVVLISAK